MEYNELMVRYGELSTKGKNRRQFIEHLRIDIKKKLIKFPVTIKASRDHLHILLNGEDPQPIIKKLQTIFGIQSICKTIRVDLAIEKIKKASLFLAQQAVPYSKTFKVKT
ncbi:MAG: tRNA uracil 4-sulfurtransferase ThiI, partial [Lactobacillaceae bacterium]